MNEERREESGEQPPAFPALDPEPERRYSWRTARYPALALVVAAVVAAAVWAGIRLSGPGGAPAAAASSPAFTDHDGLVVFEQTSGLLGTAGPDGTHPLIRKNLPALQGNDLAVPSAGGHYLVNQEGQLVTMAAQGPVSVATLPGAQAAQSSGDSWANVSFADGGKYVVATECGVAGASGDPADVAYLVPTAGGKQTALTSVTGSAGDPASAGALLSVPAAGVTPGCDAQPPPDQAVELAVPGQPARTVSTAAVLLRALGWSPATPVWLDAYPDPVGAALVVWVTQATPLSPDAARRAPPRSAQFLVSRAGRVVSRLRLPAGAELLAWSPDGKRIAACSASQGHQTSVSVLAAGGGAVTTIKLPGHQDQACAQLLWSPDATQLLYSGIPHFKGLTEADRVQHGWTVVDVRAGAAHDVTASGQPVAWLPAGPAAPAAP